MLILLKLYQFLARTGKDFMKNIFIFLLPILIGFAVYKFYLSQKNASTIFQSKYSVTINEHVYGVELADDDNERAKGLSDRDSLSVDQGLLFLFPAHDRYAFWMKDMRFPIDIIWLDEDLIVDISESVPVPVTATYLPRYQPKLPVNKVLELNSGEIKKYGLTVGQKVTFTNVN